MSLRLDYDGQTAHLLIDRADKRNAFTMAMWEALPGLLEQVRDKGDIRLLILRAADGGTFCAGADIRELLANKDDADWRAANQAAINRVQHDLARFDLPTMAFVEGDAIGGGCGLALACDLRVATPAARFGITPAKLGLVYPLHDVKLLVDLVGPGQARRMLYTGALLSAEEAQRIGLVETIADSPAALADAIMAASPHSIREIKRIVRRVLDGQAEDDAETRAIFAAAFDGADFAEGTAAFVEKRKPEFGK
ncbi:enoyl-CoA hydratase/isomerase family protein [Aurantiacibacter gangjinensis]|uniref:Enoyl-CoA hydratase n=1 Tax=Aurantiacibacter gangjinensis TaxID=502682 RepID=A0A0G9MMV7_9SPHN|nr:enoyl-CoA hydratase/isomerase family protein [Aurantiacibacter gangjinensis]APE28122.1 Enoyl-CoA hydratase [Aurantiacibacter gangjinensis]KLE32042.1 enoyl-CoA hydratase [Aurantiacibacter gangjinensis]